jgi:hypothetical protein
MGRPPRIAHPGALYHVRACGNEREPILRDADSSCAGSGVKTPGTDFLQANDQEYGDRRQGTHHTHSRRPELACDLSLAAYCPPP